MSMEPILFASKIVKYCKEKDKKFIFISGNGGAGKTELSILIANESKKYGTCNVINMDEFIVDSTLRANSKTTWTDLTTGQERNGKFTTSCAESYFLQNVNAIICNLKRGNNYWHFPKKAKSANDSITEYKANAFVTIIEGVGSVFIDRDKEKSLSIFMQCSNEVEIERRIKRARYSNEQSPDEVRRLFEERNSQYEANIMPYAQTHHIIVESLANFELVIKKDDSNICKGLCL